MKVIKRKNPKIDYKNTCSCCGAVGLVENGYCLVCGREQVIVSFTTKKVRIMYYL